MSRISSLHPPKCSLMRPAFASPHVLRASPQPVALYENKGFRQASSIASSAVGCARHHVTSAAVNSSVETAEQKAAASPASSENGSTSSPGATGSASTSLTAGSTAPVPPWKAAVDFKWVRDNRVAMDANIRERKANADVALVVELYEEFVSKNTVSPQ